MTKKRRRRSPPASAPPTQRPQRPGPEGALQLRIIGGIHRGRKLKYSGDPRTRPMKDRVREAVFNLLGPGVVGSHAMDLFAGTGALGLEALSRGAARATFFERHYPTAGLIRDNVAVLGVEERSEVIAADTFIWFRKHFQGERAAATYGPWLAFVSPPYDFFDQRRDDMLGLLGRLRSAAPPRSVLVLECLQSFDPAGLEIDGEWDVRDYPPSRVAIGRLN